MLFALLLFVCLGRGAGTVVIVVINEEFALTRRTFRVIDVVRAALCGGGVSPWVTHTHGRTPR